MKMYFVHEVLKAKENNPNFAGEIYESYIGKGGRVYLKADIEKGFCTGWKRKHFAEKYAEWNRTEGNKFDAPYWDLLECEVIEAEGIE